MRIDAIAFANKNQAASKSPRYIIEIDFTDEVLRLTGNSDTPVPADGNDVVHGSFRVVSSSSQRIDPNIGKSTIGGISFEAIDLTSTITAKIRTKLQTDGLGLQNKTVTIKYGYDGLAYTEFETVETQRIQDVKLNKSKYVFVCEDIQRAAKKQIFDEVKTTLAANLAVDETGTITVFDTADFSLVEHGTSYSDAPSATVGYVEIKQGDKREVIRYTGSTSTTFTTLTRGVLNTRAQAFTFESGGADNGITVRQFVYIEMPVLKMAYALLTGDLIGQATKVLPPEWHLDIDAAWVDQSQFTDHLDLYDSSDDTAGFIARIEGVPRSDGKTFIEKELMVLAGTFMPVQADGSLGLKRMADVQPDAGYVGVLDSSNVVSYGNLRHAMREVFNKLEIQWNYSVTRKEFSRVNILVDAVSQATHGESKTKILKFRGLYGSRHSSSILDTLFNVLRDRYAGPPLRIPLTCHPSMNVYEIGDTVRVRLPIEDYSSSATLDRSFEVQRRTINWLTGRVVFDLFSSSQRATLITPAATSFLATGYYSSGLTAGNEINAANFPGGVSSSGGVTTISADITLNGNADMNNNAAIYWCSEALTLNAGVTISIDKNVQIRALGHFTINGDIDGIAASNDTAITGYCGAMVEAQWGMVYDHGANHDFYISLANAMDTPLQRRPLYELIPFLNIEVDANGIASGIPTDCRGISGAQGGRLYSADYASVTATGGAGGTGGAGLAIVSRGGSFGGSGAINLSGGPGIKGGTVDPFGKTLHAGCGSPGGPGACHWIVDGASSTVPTLPLNFVGKMGAVDLDGSLPVLTGDRTTHPEPGGNGVAISSAIGLNPARDENGPQDSTQIDISQSVQRVQVVAGYVAPAEDVDDPLADLTAEELEALAAAKNATYNQATAPTLITHPNLTAGDTWYATLVPGTFIWNGSNWNTKVGNVGATAGVDLKKSDLTVLGDSDVITSEGTSNDTSNVDGTAAGTVAGGAAAGATANQDSTASILAGDLTGSVDGTAVSTVVSGAALGGAGAGLLFRQSTFTTYSPSECYIHGFDDAGAATDSNARMNFPDDPNYDFSGTSGQARVLRTQVAGILGYIVYRKAGSLLTIGGATRRLFMAWRDRSGDWYYDRDTSGGAASFTPTSDDYAIGTILTHATTAHGDLQAAQVWQDAVPLVDAPHITVDLVADLMNSGLRIPVGDGATFSWTWDGTYQSPVATTQDITVEFHDNQGGVMSSRTVRFTFDGSTDDDQVTAANQASSGEATTLTAAHAGGGVNDGYVTSKIVHDSTGAEAYVSASVTSSGGSGGK